MINRSIVVSPLQKFVEAKQRIGVIFADIDKYVDDSFQFLRDIRKQDPQFVSEAYLSDIGQFETSIKTIRDVLSRDHMKVVFFGRTSNGKSTAINAMLCSKILPSGMGHTTRCFVQVESSPNGQKFVLVENSPEPKNVESIDSLTHALCSNEMAEDSLVRLFWPKNDSKLLQNDVVLVDSPGIDVSPEFDCWIDKHCLDADVFVLVSNAESTLTQTEKNFFHRVNDKLSRPNIFILNNRWDASAVESDMIDKIIKRRLLSIPKVKDQHMKQFVKFLVEDLAVYSSDEARNRVFFVSARETLNHRLKTKGLSVSPAFALADGFQGRILEFENFERQFELCITQTALQTKFESHIAKGKHLSTRTYDIMENVHFAVNREKETVSDEYERKINELIQSQHNYNNFIKEEKFKIEQLAAEVQLKVSAECYEEILRLESVVDAFQRPFYDDQVHILEYKKDLIDHVDQIVTDQLQLRCTGGLLQRILERENEMVVRSTLQLDFGFVLLLASASKFLPENLARRTLTLLQYRQPFKFSFALNCQSLLSDFGEDLRFQFSLSFTRLLGKIMQIRRKRRTKNNAPNAGLFGVDNFIPRSLSRIEMDDDQLPSTSTVASSLGDQADAVLVQSIIYTSASYVANGGVGLILVGGALYRSVGWKVIAGLASIYGLFYLYERLSWNNRTKERSLKHQIRRHLCYKLNQQSETISANCENQVTREVNEVLCRLQEIASQAHCDMKDNVEILEKRIHDLDGLSKIMTHKKNNGKFICTELDMFWKNHLLRAFSK
uniref:Dynamin-type G domain-containing protein n=1 Tax=Romanomermis culicivorax TaxID=13658 RepID=A0A915J964_ROMCU